MHIFLLGHVEGEVVEDDALLSRLPSFFIHHLIGRAQRTARGLALFRGRGEGVWLDEFSSRRSAPKRAPGPASQFGIDSEKAARNATAAN